MKTKSRKVEIQIVTVSKVHNEFSEMHGFTEVSFYLKVSGRYVDFKEFKEVPQYGSTFTIHIPTNKNFFETMNNFFKNDRIEYVSAMKSKHNEQFIGIGA